MGNYTIFYSRQAEEDIDSLARYIAGVCFAPLTAKKYISELQLRIQWLEHNADVFPVVLELSYRMGFQIRRLNFNKMAILYSIEDDVVYIHRIMAQSLIVY